MKKVIYPIFIVCTISFFSCDLQEDAGTLTLNPSIESKLINEVDIHNDGVCSASDRSYCDDDLTNDGCSFTSGEAKLDSYMINDFELLLNNCNTESLPANCSWLSENTSYLFYDITLSHCCYDFNAYNLRLSYILDAAQTNRPASNDVIVGYETSFILLGVPKMRIKIIYRKKRCSLIHVDHYKKVK